MASLLGRAGAFLLKTVGPGLLGRAGQWLMEKGSKWFGRGLAQTKNIPVVGNMVSEWVGSDSFRKNMTKHGSQLIDRVSDRLIRIPVGGNAGQQFSDGLKRGFAKVTGQDQYGGGGPGGGADAQMTDESVPVQRTQPTMATGPTSMSTVASTLATTVGGSLYA